MPRTLTTSRFKLARQPQARGADLAEGRVERASRLKNRGRLWLKDGSGIQLRPEHGNHVWTYDFVHERTQDGQAIKLLSEVDEFSRECLAIRGGRRTDASDVLSTLAGLFLQHGVPQCLRSDKGSEMTANELLDGEIITTIPEAKVLMEQWRRHTNTVRPHRSLGYRPPVLEADPRPPRGPWPGFRIDTTPGQVRERRRAARSRT